MTKTNKGVQEVPRAWPIAMALLVRRSGEFCGWSRACNSANDFTFNWERSSWFYNGDARPRFSERSIGLTCGTKKKMLLLPAVVCSTEGKRRRRDVGFMFRVYGEEGVWRNLVGCKKHQPLGIRFLGQMQGSQDSLPTQLIWGLCWLGLKSPTNKWAVPWVWAKLTVFHFKHLYFIWFEKEGEKKERGERGSELWVSFGMRESLPLFGWIKKWKERNDVIF